MHRSTPRAGPEQVAGIPANSIPARYPGRRRQAIAQVKAGHTLSAVARQFSASVSSVHRWWQAYEREGPRGLRHPAFALMLMACSMRPEPA